MNEQSSPIDDVIISWHHSWVYLCYMSGVV